MKRYDPKKIEPKWQKYWTKEKTFEVEENAKKEKFYGLIEFPYPSGEGLHVGHPRPFTAMDVITRKKRMEGKNVLFPIGFDAFGLPTENFAIKTGKPPAEVTKKNIANFTRQLKMLGFGFDWSRQVDTTDPNYYKWTQSLFLQFYKHGLAYKKNQPINWCPKDKIGLANEEVVGGNCERCGTTVEKRNKEQWMLGITKYADKLLEGLKDVNYIERARASQENWIGKSEGAEVVFPLQMVSGQPDNKHSVTVFTTRPDTIFGVTFLAVSAELAKSWLDNGWQTNEDVKKYITETLKDRAATTTREEQEKTGIDAGIVAVNPVSKEQIPVWITNYVMGGVGTGAIMGVPAHDERDFDFAKKFGLSVKQVVKGNNEMKEKTKYLIFDFDGVIGDTWEACLEVQMKVGDFAKKFASKEEAKESTLQYFNRKPNHAKDTLFTSEQLQARLEWVKKFGEEMVKMNPPLFDGFNKIVRGLPNIKTAIISSGSGVYIRNRIVETGLNPTHVLTYEDHHSKEEKIEQVCKDWNVSMQDVYYFTDSKADVYELENCLDRKKIIGCAWGYCGYDLLKELLPENQILKDFTDINKLFSAELFTEEGVVINSGFLNGLKTGEAKEKMIAWLQENKIGKKQINYKLRDWVFSRQRYWGEPIPLVYCERCKNKKQKVLIIHGFRSSGVTTGALQKQLEAQGFEVLAPVMSTKDEPVFEKWMEELAPYVEQLGEDDIVVGHSLGGHAALGVLAKTKKNIGSLYLIAPAVGNYSAAYWDKRKKDHAGHEGSIDLLRAFIETPIDVVGVSNLVKNKTVIWSTDDDHVPEPTRSVYPIGWYLNTVQGFGHFYQYTGSFLSNLIGSAKNTGWVPLPESELPLKLPKVEKYQPTDTGESPLAAMEKWVKTKCPNCNGPARRETDTMPNWAGSSWYFLAYALGGENRLKLEGDKFWNQDLLKYWQPVDWYNGGMEHTVLHLLYSRFWNQFLYDVGLVPTSEPYKKRTSHGMILAKGGEKMSKSRGNVVNPDEMVEQFGADTLRTYIMFMGPFDQAVEWDTNGLVGVRRFLEKVWGLHDKISKESAEDKKLQTVLHQTIKKVTEDIDGMRFNTAISKMMELANEMSKFEQISSANYSLFVKLLSPFAPHMCEELWNQLGYTKSVATEQWPQYDEKLIVETEITLAVQVNGKLRDTLTVAADISEEDAKKTALASVPVQKWLEGKEPKKVIYVKGKLISIVV